MRPPRPHRDTVRALAFRDHAARVRARPIGPLEWSVLDAVWARAEPVTVHDIAPQFPHLAYTTLMTTLDDGTRSEFSDGSVGGGHSRTGRSWSATL